MFESLSFASDLAAALEDGAIADGVHLGVTDSEYVARVLRAFITLVEDGVISHDVVGKVR